MNIEIEHREAAAQQALHRLFKIAKSDTGQSARRVADFLLAWWNAGRDGGFDFTHFWSLDQHICDDMLNVAWLISRRKRYPDFYGIDEFDIRSLVTQRRDPSRRRLTGPAPIEEAR